MHDATAARTFLKHGMYIFIPYLTFGESILGVLSSVRTSAHDLNLERRMLALPEFGSWTVTVIMLEMVVLVCGEAREGGSSTEYSFLYSCNPQMFQLCCLRVT